MLHGSISLVIWYGVGVYRRISVDRVKYSENCFWKAEQMKTDKPDECVTSSFNIEVLTRGISQLIKFIIIKDYQTPICYTCQRILAYHPAEW